MEPWRIAANLVAELIIIGACIVPWIIMYRLIHARWIGWILSGWVLVVAIRALAIIGTHGWFLEYSRLWIMLAYAAFGPGNWLMVLATRRYIRNGNSGNGGSDGQDKTR